MTDTWDEVGKRQREDAKKKRFTLKLPHRTGVSFQPRGSFSCACLSRIATALLGGSPMHDLKFTHQPLTFRSAELAV